MSKYRNVTLSGMLVSLTVILQLIPVFMSEVFIIITVFSTIPIFIISITSPRLGILSYLSSAVLISIFSIHEGIMFLFTNGMIGVALGIAGFYFNNWLKTTTIAAITISISLALLNYVIGIPVFGSQIPGSFLMQLLIILVFSFIYCILLNKFAHLIYRYLKKHINLI